MLLVDVYIIYAFEMSLIVTANTICLFTHINSQSAALAAKLRLIVGRERGEFIYLFSSLKRTFFLLP